MDFLEKDLEDIIFEADNLALFENGLETLIGKMKRQVRIGNYGIADIVSIVKPTYSVSVKDYPFSGHNDLITINIIELKQKTLNMDSLEQIIRYAKGVEHYLTNRNINANILMTLIGKSVDTNSSFVYFSDTIKNLQIYTYSYELNGINFNLEEEYKLVNSGFKDGK